MVVRALDFEVESRLRPWAAGAEAFRHFCRPDLSPHLSPLQNLLVARARYHLGKAHWFRVATPAGPVQAYDYAPVGEPSGRTVLLVHGWTSEAAFMAAFAEPLRQKGHRVVAFDFPAHGYSPGRSASLMDCARATAAVSERLRTVDAVIAHSIGALAVLLVAEGGPPLHRPFRFGRLALISAPNRMRDVALSYGRHLRLGQVAQSAFHRHLERVARRPLTDFAAARLLEPVDAPVLLVHSRDDDHVPARHAEEIKAARPGVRLHLVDGLGHSKVLYAPPIVRLIRDFVSERPDFGV